MNIKKIAFLLLFSAQGWAGGWFYDQTAADDAHSAAIKNPLSRHVVSVYADSNFQGTGVAVLPRVVATADHVLRRHIEKMSCTVKGPFSEFQLGGAYPYFVRQPDALDQEDVVHAVDKICTLQEYDLMFLMLDASKGGDLTPASVVSKDGHSDWVKRFRVLNMPHVSGSIFCDKNPLPAVTYLGYGSWAVGGTHPPGKSQLEETHNNGPRLYTDYKLRQGVFEVSQQFSHPYSRCGDIFYGWHNIRTPRYASALLGDSGGPCFTKDGDLLGLISTIHVSEAFADQPVVGTKITSLQGLLPDSRESLTVWESFSQRYLY